VDYVGREGRHRDGAADLVGLRAVKREKRPVRT
jgi:hypothetical protein